MTDAVGFFALVDETADPFAFAAALLGDPSVDSVRRRLELTDLFDRWGREYATQPDWEGGFAFAAPGAAGLQAPRTPGHPHRRRTARRARRAARTSAPRPTR